MIATLPRLIALLFGSYLLTMAAAFQSLLLPVRGGIENFPTFSLGLLGSFWALGFVAGSYFVPRLVARVGHIRSFGIMCALSAIIILVNLLWINPWFWVATRILTGFCMAGSFMIIESWLGEDSTPENRGTVFGIYMMVVTVGYTSGQMGFGLVDPLLFVPFVICGIFYCLALLPTAFSTVRQPSPLSQSTLSIKHVQNSSPVAIVTILLVGLNNGAFGTLGPVFAQKLLENSQSIALFMSAATIGGALLQFPLGKLSDQIDRRYVIAGTAIAGGLISLGFVTLTLSSIWLVAGLSLIFGMMIYTLYPIAVSHANDWAQEINATQVASTLLFVYGIGTMIGPLLASGLMALVGPQGLFMFTGITLLLTAAYAVYRLIVAPAVPEASKGEFVVIPLSRSQTPETISLDPRLDEEETQKEDA